MNIYLIDGNSFIFRAFYSLKSMFTSHNIPIGALYGFTNVLLKIINNKKNEIITIILDSKHKNFRHTIYKNYKSHRPKTNILLQKQFSIIKTISKILNIKVIEIDGVEADDVISAYTTIALKEKYTVIILGSDKDLIQLLKKNVIIYDPLQNKYIDEEFVQNKFGIESSKILDYLSLVGDKSDNIPGVQGIGPVNAIKLLKQFITIEKIYQKYYEINNKRIQDLLLKDKKNAYLSKKLISLKKTGYQLPYKIEELKYKGFDKDKIKNFLYQYECIYYGSQIYKIDQEIINKTRISYKQNVTLIEKIKDAAIEAGEIYFLQYRSKVTIFCKGHTYILEMNKTEGITTINSLNTILYDKSIKKIIFNNEITQDLKHKIPCISEIHLKYYIIFRAKSRNNICKIANHLSILYFEKDASLLYLINKEIDQRIYKYKLHYIIKVLEKSIVLLLLKMTNYGIRISTNIFKLHFKNSPLNYFVHQLLKTVDFSSQRAHITFSSKTTTGKIICCQPVLQNSIISIINRHQMKKVFISKNNNNIIYAEYPELSLRILAYKANIKKMSDTFRKNLDIYQVISNIIFNPEEVITNKLLISKTIALGIIQNINILTLSQYLSIDKDKIIKYIKRYLTTYKEIKRYIKITKKKAKRDGYIKSIDSIKYFTKNSGIAVKNVIESSISEIMKNTMIHLNKETQNHLILQIKNGLLFEIPSKITGVCINDIVLTMKNNRPKNFPVSIKICYGKSWYNTKNTYLYK